MAKLSGEMPCDCCGQSSGFAGSASGSVKALRDELEEFMRYNGWTDVNGEWWCPSCSYADRIQKGENLVTILAEKNGWKRVEDQ